MLSIEEIRNQLYELESKYPKSFKVRRGDNDSELIQTIVSKKAHRQVFQNGDETIIRHISQCLQDGQDVVVHAAGKEAVMVHSAKGLFPKKDAGCFIATSVYPNSRSKILTTSVF